MAKGSNMTQKGCNNAAVSQEIPLLCAAGCRGNPPATLIEQCPCHSYVGQQQKPALLAAHENTPSLALLQLFSISRCKSNFIWQFNFSVGLLRFCPLSLSLYEQRERWDRKTLLAQYWSSKSWGHCMVLIYSEISQSSVRFIFLYHQTFCFWKRRACFNEKLMWPSGSSYFEITYFCTPYFGSMDFRSSEF